MQKLPVPQSAQAPADAFTGSVLHEALRGPMEGSLLAMAHVHFAPGARTH